ncbi:hypothetical protein O3W44_21820 [Pantoea sp. LMR881]|nr:hypothetical protein [Pantoea sp. LMR881]MCZ4061169.1 hypothetical protein [Pantoea sp. LMR881]
MNNLNNSLLASLKEIHLEPTGEYEVSGFHEVDGAAASYVSRILILPA